MTDAERAERLAAIRSRRGQAPIEPGALPPPRAEWAPPTTSGVAPTGSITGSPPVRSSSGRRRHRAGPAAGSKIAVAGASATAVLGIVAGLGWAEQRSAAGTVTAPPTQAPLTAPARPVVVVVLRDGTVVDGTEIITDPGSDVPAITDDTTPGAAATDVTSDPRPVAAPRTVDLAIPAVARPSVAAPAPTPQATSSGS